MNKIALCLASILTFQSTPLYTTPPTYAQEQKVSIPSQHKKTSFLEQLIDTLEITQTEKEKQRIIKGYNPKIDYQSKYQDITKQIWELPLVQYKNSHFLADNKNMYEFGNIRIQMDNTYFDAKNNAIIAKDKPSMDLLVRYDQVEHQHWDSAQKKVIKEDRIVKEFQSIVESVCENSNQCTYKINTPNSIKTNPNEKDTINQAYYLASHLAKISLGSIQSKNKKWLAQPWTQPQEEYKKTAPIDPKTGEFIFYGEDWCKPCHEIADYLFEQKIPFQEKSQKDASTLCKGGVPYILKNNNCIGVGKPIIMDLIRKIYKK